MSAELVFLFMGLRGYWGSVSDREACRQMRDSITLFVLLGEMAASLPAPTTILENINCVSNGTRDFILECQLQHIMDDGLDDFADIQIDSTGVSASTCWPTDALHIKRLVGRAYGMGRKLDRFGLPKFEKYYMEDWQEGLGKTLFKINNTTSKKDKKLRKLYSDHLKIGHKALGHLTRSFEKAARHFGQMDMRPSSRRILAEFLEAIEDDILALSSVLHYAGERVFNGVILPSSDKILSLSDKSAAFIKKGQRESLIGYKPQLCRSSRGFVTALILEKGNPSDSENLFPCVLKNVLNTGVLPATVSGDSGYASRKGYNDCIEIGVEDVCIGGSKGKALLGEELWNSKTHVDVRRMRSGVESLMFTLKYVFEFGHMRRRGLENVRAEMTEKIFAYNFAMIARRKAERREDLECEAMKTG
jgi:hypothetical protein